MSTVALGVVLGLVGSIAINTGNNLQSLGMQQLEDEDSDQEVNICDNRTWLIGTTIFITGALLNFASYGFAPQSTLASLESIQFVTNLFFSKVLLKKDISLKMYAGTILTVSGTVLAVAFSSKEAATVEIIPDLLSLWENYLWIGYLCFLVTLAGIFQVVYKLMEKREDKSEGFQHVMAAIYALLSALWGTLSVVFAKLLAILLEFQATGDNVNIFSHWFTWIILIGWLVLMSFWLYRLNSALGLYNPLFIIPLLQANFIFFAIVSGGIYFKEFNYMEKFQWAGFTCGVCCMFLGIFVLIPDKLVVETTPMLELQALKTPRAAATFRKFSVCMSPHKFNTHRHRRVSMFFMPGAGRLNQRAFDLKGYERRLKRLENAEIRTEPEEKLLSLLHKIIEGANKRQEKEDRYQLIEQKTTRSPSELEEQKILRETLDDFDKKFGKAEKVIEESERHIVNAKNRGVNKLVNPELTVFSELYYNWSFRTLHGSIALSKIVSDETPKQIRLNDVKTRESLLLPFRLGQLSSPSTKTLDQRGFSISQEIISPDLRTLNSSLSKSSNDLELSSSTTIVAGTSSPSVRVSTKLHPKQCSKAYRF